MIKEEILNITKKINEFGLVKGTWGNVSIKNGEKIYITPSGVPYDTLKENDIVEVDLEGNILSGKNPSSELPTHLKIYAARADVKVVIHTHPIYATAVSLIVDHIPPLVEDSVMLLGSKINVAEYALPGTKRLGENSVSALGSNNAVILKNHGLITVGETWSEALIASLICEKTAQIFLEALKSGLKISEISSEDSSILREKYLSSYRQ
ncbi:aldolase [Petrotoga sp. 9PW.55.5.1]|uniref:class II aldolase/adducin family protein n=1 Tax=Petrotoga sp. 9PW.55.5.1 TaxID=1308979 RepID=UPI000DC3E816|nr:class II aldolase/adducin family protein [Petrotoga sp. 9PW.55.5.1]RAO98355.1 aldolase [Petrotoga sp. 9PW.55.5.1]